MDESLKYITMAASKDTKMLLAIYNNRGEMKEGSSDMTDQEQAIPLREAAARYLRPDNIDEGYAIIDANTNSLVWRISIITWAIRILFLLSLVTLLYVSDPGWWRLGAGMALLGLYLAFERFGMALLHNPVFDFLWPRPDPELRQFMDMLATGEIKAFTGLEPNEIRASSVFTTGSSK
ncbi:MAG TPA: hypothetical protein PKC48_13140 [Sphingorhabdus sp.]|nr:hypothetical protein [Sphingorhabdus sp.]